MGLYVLSNNKNNQYGVKEILVDSIDDLKMGKLVNNYSPGSEAYVVSEGAYYILNPNKRWIFSRKIVSDSTDENINISNGEIDGGGAFGG